MRLIQNILRLIILERRPADIGLCCWHEKAGDTW
jgi:hypothetical protein